MSSDGSSIDRPTVFRREELLSTPYRELLEKAREDLEQQLGFKIEAARVEQITTNGEMQVWVHWSRVKEEPPE
jgi:hypothetical protein